MPLTDGRADLCCGPILGIMHHLAACKVMYASAVFRGGERSWPDCFARIKSLGTSVAAARQYLEDGQGYWLASWADLPDAELWVERSTNWGERWPTWRIIHTITQHDAYHAGQIIAFRSMLKPAEGPLGLEEGRDR
jgi:uncharacterized damage-inducible protein DinB